jgi:hypothetical protein
MVGLLKKARAQGRFWWHLYLDNFAAAEVGQADSSFAGAQELHQQAEELWATAGVISAPKKRKMAEITGQEL